METTYENQDNKLIITEPSVTEISIEELVRNKENLEMLINNIKASRDTEISVLQDNLEAVNILISKANQLGIELSPELPEDKG